MRGCRVTRLKFPPRPPERSMPHISQIVMASHLLKQTLNQFHLANVRLALWCGSAL